jgi:hypothetical protein
MSLTNRVDVQADGSATVHIIAKAVISSTRGLGLKASTARFCGNATGSFGWYIKYTVTADGDH